MIGICDMSRLEQCVETAFERNSHPESNCAFCSSSRKSILQDFEFIISDPGCRMVGHFDNGALTGFLGCFFNPDNNWVDCIGPFFKSEWNHAHAADMFLFAEAELVKAVRFNFYFNAENKNCHRLMEALSAERNDNEYILTLDASDYEPLQPERRVVNYADNYGSELIHLHDTTFPDIYVTGKGITDSVGKTREVFCALDEHGTFAGYGVLKYADNTKYMAAEIFAIKKEKRGQGYGRALLNSVANSAFNNHNGSTVHLVVDKLNADAKSLYYSFGFKLKTENEAFCKKSS